VAGLGWYPCSRLKHNWSVHVECGPPHSTLTDQLCFSLLHGYHPKPDTPKLQHTSKQEHTTNVVIKYKICRLLMMDVLMSETC
jgi:hypothetical protein